MSPSFVEKPAGRGFRVIQLNALIRAGSLAAAAVALVFAHGFAFPATSYLLAGLGIGLITGAGSILYCCAARPSARLAGGLANARSGAVVRGPGV